jgi:Family of unknown function (DUF6789)
MTKLTTRSIEGLVAGAAGTIAMGGMSFFLRRMVEPTNPIGKTHYEAVVESVAGATNGDDEIEPALRIRLGELLHLGFGAFWGLVFALSFRRSRVRPIRDGGVFGLVLWVGAFGGYMPAMGISRSLRQMKPYELMRTLLCHLTYSITTITFLRTMRSRSGDSAV